MSAGSTCPRCQAATDPRWRHCPHCAAPLGNVRQAAPPPSPFAPKAANPYAEAYYGVAYQRLDQQAEATRRQALLLIGAGLLATGVLGFFGALMYLLSGEFDVGQMDFETLLWAIIVVGAVLIGTVVLGGVLIGSSSGNPATGAASGAVAGLLGGLMGAALAAVLVVVAIVVFLAQLCAECSGGGR